MMISLGRYCILAHQKKDVERESTLRDRTQVLSSRDENGKAALT